MIQFEPGCVYDVAHLRPFNLELALQGHPLALPDGSSVRHLRKMSDSYYSYDRWYEDTSSWFCTRDIYCMRLEDSLRLTPLAVKDGRPLHVGDEIEFRRDPHDQWATKRPECWVFSVWQRPSFGFEWRWPVKKKE